MGLASSFDIGTEEKYATGYLKPRFLSTARR